MKAGINEFSVIVLYIFIEIQLYTGWFIFRLRNFMLHFFLKSGV